MKTSLTAFCFLFLCCSTPVLAKDITPAEAKKLAQEALDTMNQVQPLAVIANPEMIDPVTYVAKFSAPLGRLYAKWPGPWWAPENKAIEPYQTCYEAALELENLQMLRTKTTLTKEIEKSRRKYFFDLKPRCEQSIKTGKFTERGKQ